MPAFHRAGATFGSPFFLVPLVIMALAGWWTLGSAWAQGAAGASGATGTVWRCPGPPVLYTNRLDAAQAAAARCEALQDLPVATGRPGTARSVGAPGAGAVTSAASSPASRIAASEQEARDRDARRILEAERAREETRLADLQRRDPRPVDEIRRVQADLDAIRRELARLR